mmetsp:Transcript_18459/g.55661  ORF Transcript_18459/g.55661 Transcript_18459/m.55661 type:complete len:222 (-) Transcript_18459:1094-1759(-)|eukprot:scaffold6363_cov25-Tisochrysis_lutea.AAC.9
MSSYDSRKRRTWRTEMRRSDALNSYGMFQPMGPNLRRSWITAWKKASPKASFLKAQALDPSVPSKKASSESGSARYEPSMLARKPLGGSLVILTPFCKIETGKCVDGADVSHKRKSGEAASGVSSSQIFSSVGIHDVHKWQFCSTTHEPARIPSVMSLRAIGPCPCPSEMAAVRLPPKPRVSAKRSSSVIGSWPGESTKMRGDVLDESLKHASRLNGGGST